MAAVWPEYAHPGSSLGIDAAPDVSRTPFEDGAVRQALVYGAPRVLRAMTVVIEPSRLSDFRGWAATYAHTWFAIAGITEQVRVVGGVGGIEYRQVAAAGAPQWDARLTLEAQEPEPAGGADTVWPVYAQLAPDYRITPDPDVARSTIEGGATRQERIHEQSRFGRVIVATLDQDDIDRFRAWAAAAAHRWFWWRDRHDGMVRRVRVRNGASGISYRQAARAGRLQWDARLTLEGDEAAVNQLPVARAGVDQDVAAGVRVTLDGSASSDPDGAIAAYAWRQTAGDTVALADDDTATPEFDAPSASAEQTLTFELTVTDDRGGQATDIVEVNVAAIPNQAPAASAGADQNVAAGARVTLDGSGSTDPDGTISAYAWVQTVGAAVVLDDDDTATPEFDAPSTSAEQTLTFRLTVTDDDGAMTSDEVSVVVAAFVAGAPVSYRFDTIEALREFAMFEEGSDGGRWEIIASASTTSSGTGPGPNSGGPYAATDTSGAGSFTEIIDNSTFDLAVEMSWPAPTGRVLRLECAIMGNFQSDGEGLMVQGMAPGGQWADIALIRGWSYSNSYQAGDDMTDFDGSTISCVQNGGWADFDIAIPDQYEQVRMRLVASGGNVYVHDVALWSAELRNP